jgi:hypothetical protein
MIKARCVIFEQTEVFHSRYVLVILDGASGPHALRACFGLGGVAPSTCISDESSTT